ncbi:hypothetical protein JF737_02960 [Mycobacterium avium]|uniref:Uncharacterized protein n=3 Tax=Mycobacterium avium complex (MAC) TaxID=120793 RepID=A0ABX3TQI2_9MYCO|nr:hypothetical protein MAV_5232 [Mycobacterium avium 104]APT13313.1 hypothetical protein BS641_26045 [Mycobacterium avium subsp. hominissuis]ETB32804.1 hypothetical protein O971_01430 [Mycobacterium avium subsp. hominissuis 10-4249]KDO92952.1 hypothetical protein MAVA5_22695 [Mycobacterium avium subsp. hominissuis A5]MCA2236199.1 hypothetical protein [Mycobacterium avium]ORB80981.1 hypothetical protein BST46_06060 [Mycobacterium timonense]TXA42436.1 hypothetical protein DKM27_07215 [Mycobact
MDSHSETKDQIVATLTSRISPGSVRLVAVGPLTSRACQAVRAVLTGNRRPAVRGPRLMSKGVERC